jgi:hypothetical protein
MLADYRPKTVPHPWQATALAHSTDAVDCFATAPYVGFFFDPRMGKTKAALDRTAILYHANEIDALLVVASPNGIHRNWIWDEIPAHLPDDVPRTCLIWQSGKHKQVGYGAEMRALLATKGLAVLAVNAEALRTPALREYLGKFLRKRRVHFVADECSFWARNIGSSMKTALAIKNHAPYRTLLDGTPEGESPLDYYAQMALLSKDILGYSSRELFNAHFAEWEERVNYTTGYGFKVVKQYRHLDELKRKVSLYTYRAHRPDSWPKPTYERMEFDLSPQQRVIYDRLRDEYEVELAGEDQKRIVAHVLTRYLRLQQIGSGFLPGVSSGAVCEGCRGEGCDDCGYLGVVVQTSHLKYIDDHNPRLNALSTLLKKGGGPFIVWARFHFDVDEILGLAKTLGLRPVQFDGRLSEEARIQGRVDYQEGRADLLVGTPTTGGRGQPMHRVATMIYYTNDYSRLVREQSECRGDHPVRTTNLRIVDLVARDTVDEDIQHAHRTKARLADLISDRKKGGGRWLR